MAEHLAAHHGEARGRAHVSNACPACGWFSAQISDWPAWDGRNVGNLDVNQLAKEAASRGQSHAAKRLRIPALGASLTALASKVPCPRASGFWPKRLASSLSPRLRHGQWRCPNCTLVNGRAALECEVCEQVRP